MAASKSDCRILVCSARRCSCQRPLRARFNIEQSEARYVDKHFRYELIVTLDAPIDRVDEVLRNYADYSITQSPHSQFDRAGAARAGCGRLWKRRLNSASAGFAANVTRVERVLGIEVHAAGRR